MIKCLCVCSQIYYCRAQDTNNALHYVVCNVVGVKV